MYHCMDRTLILGVEHCSIPNLEHAIEEIKASGMRYLVTPVCHGYSPPIGSCAAGLMTDAFGIPNCEMALKCDTWTKYVVAKISTDLDTDGRQTPPDRAVDRGKKLTDMLIYMKQLGVRAAMISLRKNNNTNLAQVLGTVANSTNPIPIWVRVQMEYKPKNYYRGRKGMCYSCLNKAEQRENADDPDDGDDRAAAEDTFNTWLWWSTLHEKVDFSENVTVALELPDKIPDGETIKRWGAEPVTAVIVPAHLFYDKNGMPVLSYAYQRLLVDLVNRTNATVVISGRLQYSLAAYAAYIQRVWHRRHVPFGDKMYNHAEGWADQVQLPLQPLQEDLEVRSYMLLEKDSAKYELYEKAIGVALNKKKAQKAANANAPYFSDEEEAAFGGYPNTVGQMYNRETDPELIRVAVLGAGRGPLVSVILNVAAATQTKVKVYAIEKNYAAALTLETRKACDWIGHDVVILKEDFRASSFRPRCDIAVYELLGSWGDNELAPECVDGASNILRSDCIYIPWRYTSYVAPMSSSKVWAAAKVGNSAFFRDDDRHLETIWVSYMKNKLDLGEPKSVFSFEHPSEPVTEDGYTVMEREGVPRVDRSRSISLSWTVNTDAVMHGFAGYFHCSLLEDSFDFNTLPQTHTEGLITWFPVFIPLRKPMRISKGTQLSASFWRCTAVGRVWYEWMAEAGGITSGIHNVNGRSSIMYCSL